MWFDKDRGWGWPETSRRRTRNLVRWRNRQAGRYWDGSKFTGKRASEKPLAEPVRRGSGLIPPKPVPASYEFCTNSQGPSSAEGGTCQGRGQHPCADCGELIPTFIALCRACFSKAKRGRQAARARAAS